MKVVIGVDAGGSKTISLVANEKGEILGVGTAGPANHQTVGLKRAIAEIYSACKNALFKARCAAPADYGVFGIAGADFPEDFVILKKELESLGIAREIKLENDTLIALRAGARKGWGVVVVCGTGLNAAGIAPDGSIYRMLGLGWISGNWGSGTDLGREIVRAVVRAWDGRGQKTILTEYVLNALGLQEPTELIYGLYKGHIQVAQLCNLVPMLFEAAYQGDQVAQDIIIRAGKEIGLLANAVIQRLGLEKLVVDVVLAGGVFKGKGPLLLDVVTQEVHRVAPNAVIKTLKRSPALGAVIIALEMLGALNESVFDVLNTAGDTLSIPHD